MITGKKLKLDAHDSVLVDQARRAIARAVEEAHAKAAVAKRLAALTMRHRNKGRLAAIKRHPFGGACEAGGGKLERMDAVLDEMDAEHGYEGRVRWVCHKANNSGKRSCGKC